MSIAEGCEGAHASTRQQWLDIARGLAIAGMIAYHLTWDLVYFRFVPAQVLLSPPFVLSGHAIASSFLFIAGFSLALANSNGLRARPFVLRLLKIAAAAALVTFATYVAFPQSYVTFGILHCIAGASVIAAIFLRARWPVSLGAGAAMCAAGFAISWPMFDSVNGWLGLGQRLPLTNDWRPLLPWASFTLLGLAAGRFAYAHGLMAQSLPQTARGHSANVLAFAGRHSLIVYLAHQPLLFGLVWLAAIAIQPQQPAAAPESPYAQACVDRCVRTQSPAAFCTSACTCIVRRAKADGIWSGILANRLNTDAQANYDEIIAACRREAGAK